MCHVKLSPALVEGELGMSMQEQDNQNVYLELAQTAARMPDKLALVVAVGRDANNRISYERRTYAQLVREIEHCSAVLHAQGITQGARVLLLLLPGVNFVVITQALFRLGAVPVFIDPGHAFERLLALIRESAPDAMIGIPLAFMLRAAQPEVFATSRANIVVDGDAPNTVRYEELLRSEPAPCPPAVLAADDVMSIVFTSGSTGMPKGVEFTPRVFQALRGPLRRERYGFRDDDVDLVTFPVILLTSPASGLTLVIPEFDAAAPGKVDPARIAEIIVEQNCTTGLGSPVFWARVAEHCLERRVTLPSLRGVLLAGAPVGAELLARMRDALPNAICHVSIGSTECGSLASIEGREILAETAARTLAGAGVCVGRAFDDHEVGVIASDEGAISSRSEARTMGVGEIGEIIVRGPGVSPRYFRRPEATNLTKIPDADGRGTWHRMGDAGYLDAQGRLWFCGRIAQVLELDGTRYYPAVAEGAFNAESEVKRSGLVKIRTGAGAALALCVELRSSTEQDAQQRLMQRLQAKAQSLRIPIQAVLVHREGFPVDARHNAKIDYAALTDWAQQQLGGAK